MYHSFVTILLVSTLQGEKPIFGARSQNLDSELLAGPGNLRLLIGFKPQRITINNSFIKF